MRLYVTFITFARGIIQAFFNLLLCVAPTAVTFAAASWRRMIPNPRKSLGLNHRRSNMKKFLTTFAVLTAIATPAFAQYAPQDYQTAAPPSGQHQSAARQNGLHAFAMVPRGSAGSTLDDPSFTGGGSTGYNQLNRSY